MKQVRAAVVGMGIGRPNGKAIAKNPRGRVVALCDLVEDRMKDFAKELPEPPKLYTDYKAMCRDKEIDADDYAGGFIRFENGSGLQCESFWASHQAPEHQIELFGTEAGARYGPLTLYRTVDGAPHDITVNLPKGPDPWDLIAGHFIDCILDGVPCDAPLRHGLIVQEMMEAMLRSAETSKEIRLGWQ